MSVQLLPMVGTGLLAGLVAILAARAVDFGAGATPVSPSIALANPVEIGPQTSPSEPVRTRGPRNAVFYAAITDRPLFAPTRRPVVAETDLEPQPVEEVVVPSDDVATVFPEFRFLGSMTTEAGALALIAAGEGAAEWLARDMEVQGWRLDAIGEDWVELSSGDRKTRLELFAE